MEGPMEDMFREYPQTEAEREVREWLKKNRHIFHGTQEWTPTEIAHIALDNKLDRQAVYNVISQGMKELQGRFENRAAMHIFQVESALMEVIKLKAQIDYIPELDLRPQWEAIHRYFTEGNEFKEAA